jgi:acetolactate synthase small subunit
MRWCFWTQMENLGRMEARVMQVLDRLQATVVSLSSVQLDGDIFLSGLMEAEEAHASRIESLLRKIHGMMTVKVVSEAAATQRMIALFRILCDITDRAEILQFVHAVNARAIMVRPRWIAFEMVGTSKEIEGIYQSAIGYGIVDVVSSSCALMTSESEPERTAGADDSDELEDTPGLPVGRAETAAPAVRQEPHTREGKTGRRTKKCGAST